MYGVGTFSIDISRYNKASKKVSISLDSYANEILILVTINRGITVDELKNVLYMRYPENNMVTIDRRLYDVLNIFKGTHTLYVANGKRNIYLYDNVAQVYNKPFFENSLAMEIVNEYRTFRPVDIDYSKDPRYILSCNLFSTNVILQILQRRDDISRYVSYDDFAKQTLISQFRFV